MAKSILFTKANIGSMGQFPGVRLDF